ncbi:hypothetical protein BGX26_006385 [Mortierella sp. AD094]|nr:hypothetical protein BGX26_006385 [Mortierella sp. AD094]
MDISELRANCRGRERTLVFSGSDYGICKLSQTVALSQARIEEHLNNYYALSGRFITSSCAVYEVGLDSDMDLIVIMFSLDPDIETLKEVPHIPIANTITAESINNSSHMAKMRSQRGCQLHKPENKGVRDALETVSNKNNSMSKATTKEEIDTVHDVRKRVRDTLRRFENN